MALIEAGNRQSAEAGSPLPELIGVKVLDRDRIALSGATVDWVVVIGGGSVRFSESVTGADGIAWNTWTLGSRLGGQAVDVSVAGVRHVSFTAAATPPAAGLESISVAPKLDTLGFGGARQFVARGHWDNGFSSTIGVSWSSLRGSMTSDGLLSVGSEMGAVEVIATHVSGLQDTASIWVVESTSDVVVTGARVTPGTAEVETSGAVQFTAEVLLSDGSTGAGEFAWSADRGSVTSQGVYVAPSAAGSDVVVALLATGEADTATVTVTSPPAPTITSLTVTPSSATMATGATRQFAARATLSDGSEQMLTDATWSASAGSITTQGRFTAPGSGGSVTITAAKNGYSATASVSVEQVPVFSGDFVEYPTEELAFIMGPQVRSGSSVNPWPFFDQNAIARGHVHGQNFPATPGGSSYTNKNYYDQGMVQYINYYRTGDPDFLSYGRKIADSWWLSVDEGANRNFDNLYAPRSASLGGLILRAMDGRPEMWDWITDYTRFHYDRWLGLRLSNSELYIGIREGGFTLLYTAWLARAHPDGAVRAEMLAKAEDAAVNYYARLQRTDGSWRWRDSYGIDGYFMQPFMVGMLMEGLIATHQLTGNPTIATAITRGVENLFERGYRTDSFGAYGGGQFRGMWYFVYGADCQNPLGKTTCGVQEPFSYEDRIREVRSLNSVTIHAFGYAYKITGNSQYRSWGDEVFAATFGNGQGPLADEWHGLADFREKEYDQHYRTAGRYLAWRAGG